MPPRWISGTIIGFWLATTGWMIYHQASLRHSAGEPPPYTIDLTDEVGANTISWEVLQNGMHVGNGKSSVHRRKDRSFVLYSDFRFEDTLKIHSLVTFRKLISTYRIDAAGELLQLSATVLIDGPLGSEIEGEVSGRVENNYFIPKAKVKIVGHDFDLPLAEKVKVAKHGNILNPMHLVNKISGLQVGQRWRIHLLNPINFQNLTVPILEAEVFSATLPWHGQDVMCYRIDYREPGKNITARTYVRQRDNLVLQQEAEHQGKTIILQRDK